MRAPFVILALPRSRTAWLSAWLTHGDRCCYHDALAYAQSRDALLRLTAGGHGLAETAGFVLPRVLHDTLPDARFLIVRRDPRAVSASLARLGAIAARQMAEAGSLLLDSAARYLVPRTPVMEVDYERLEDPRDLDMIWRFLRGDVHDEARTKRLMDMRVTKINPFDGFPPRELLAEEERLKGQQP